MNISCNNAMYTTDVPDIEIGYGSALQYPYHQSTFWYMDDFELAFYEESIFPEMEDVL